MVLQNTTRQLRYMGGGCSGCGGYVMALAIDLVSAGTSRYVLYEYISDQSPGESPRRWRWREYASEEAILAAWDHCWTLVNNDEGWSAWAAAGQERPWWGYDNRMLRVIEAPACAPHVPTGAEIFDLEELEELEELEALAGSSSPVARPSPPAPYRRALRSIDLD